MSDALYRIDAMLISGLQEDVKRLDSELRHLLRTILTGGELYLFDQLVHFEVTWPQGPPFGLSNAKVAELI